MRSFIFPLLISIASAFVLMACDTPSNAANQVAKQDYTYGTTGITNG